MKRFMFLFAAVCLLVLGATISYAQDATTADFDIQVTVGSVPLAIANTADMTLDDGGAGTLTPGVAVAAVPDGADAWLQAGLGGSGTGTYQPNLGGAPAAFDITGAPAANVIVSFALPYVLYPQAAGNGVVHVDYNGTSACWVDGAGTAHYFNPKLGETVALNVDPATATHMNLGGIFTVDKNAATDIYEGVGIVTVAYAAN
jgi:hypothetical protein